MAPINNPVDDKRHYEKPRLRVIALASDEVLAAGCKTDVTVAFGSFVSCNGASCAGLGS